MRNTAVKWQSRADGEYRLCSRCLHIGYGEDSYHPATDEFWPRVHGQLWFGRCLACACEMGSRRKGIVPADPLPPLRLIVSNVSHDVAINPGLQPMKLVAVLLNGAPLCRGYSYDINLRAGAAAHG